MTRLFSSRVARTRQRTKITRHGDVVAYRRSPEAMIGTIRQVPLPLGRLQHAIRPVQDLDIRTVDARAEFEAMHLTSIASAACQDQNQEADTQAKAPKRGPIDHVARLLSASHSHGILVPCRGAVRWPLLAGSGHLCFVLHDHRVAGTCLSDISPLLSWLAAEYGECRSCACL